MFSFGITRVISALHSSMIQDMLTSAILASRDLSKSLLFWNPSLCQAAFLGRVSSKKDQASYFLQYLLVTEKIHESLPCPTAKGQTASLFPPVFSASMGSIALRILHVKSKITSN